MIAGREISFDFIKFANFYLIPFFDFLFISFYHSFTHSYTRTPHFCSCSSVCSLFLVSFCFFHFKRRSNSNGPNECVVKSLEFQMRKKIAAKLKSASQDSGHSVCLYQGANRQRPLLPITSNPQCCYSFSFCCFILSVLAR